MDILSVLSAILVLLVFLLIGKFVEAKCLAYGRKILRMRLLKNVIPESWEKFLALLSLLLKYLIYLAGLIVFVEMLQIKAFEGIFYSLLLYLPNVVLAFLIFLIGISIGQLVKRTVEFVLFSTGIDELFVGIGGFRPSFLAGVFFEYLVVVIAIILALSQLGLQTQILIYITSIVLGILTFFGFYTFYTAVKNILPDITASFVLRNGKYLKIGEYIIYEGKKYRVIDIGMVFTILSADKQHIYVRTSKLLQGFKKEE